MRFFRGRMLLLRVCLSFAAGSRVVNIVRGKDRVLHPSDLLILVCFQFAPQGCLMLHHSVSTSCFADQFCHKFSITSLLRVVDSHLLTKIFGQGCNGNLRMLQYVSKSRNCTETCCLQGFLYAYVCYLTEDVCLTLITADAGDFHPLRTCKQKIVDGTSNHVTPCELDLI